MSIKGQIWEDATGMPVEILSDEVDGKYEWRRVGDYQVRKYLDKKTLSHCLDEFKHFPLPRISELDVRRYAITRTGRIVEMIAFTSALDHGPCKWDLYCTDTRGRAMGDNPESDIMRWASRMEVVNAKFTAKHPTQIIATRDEWEIIRKSMMRRAPNANPMAKAPKFQVGDRVRLRNDLFHATYGMGTVVSHGEWNDVRGFFLDADHIPVRHDEEYHGRRYWQSHPDALEPAREGAAPAAQQEPDPNPEAPLPAEAPAAAPTGTFLPVLEQPSAPRSALDPAYTSPWLERQKALARGEKVAPPELPYHGRIGKMVFVQATKVDVEFPIMGFTSADHQTKWERRDQQHYTRLAAIVRATYFTEPAEAAVRDNVLTMIEGALRHLTRTGDVQYALLENKKEKA